MSNENQVEVCWHEHAVSRDKREGLNGHKGCILWFTGLSASGKSTVANLVDHKLHAMGVHSFVLDGDNVRHGLNAGPAMLREQHSEEFAQRFGLGFSAEDREENIRRIAAVTKLFSDAGILTSLHCCGMERAVVEYAAEHSSLNCIDPLEVGPMGDCDLGDLKKRFGSQLALKGNLHTTSVMLEMDEEGVRREARACLEAAMEGGGYILSTGDQCGRDTPDANIAALVDVCERYGRY